MAQGGSTITQQVAKSFFDKDLRISRSLFRKIPEAILARRIEARYSKRDILTLYLNQIFLGHTAYGVAAAARRYFDKTVDELDLGEMATIAGIARAPSRFAPTANLQRAQTRRDQVLAAMVAAGFINAEDEARWRGRPLVLRTPPDFFRDRSPYFSRTRAPGHRKDATATKMLYEGGLEIETTVVPWIDVAAQENVDFSLRKLDKRQGWRGPVARLAGDAAEQFRQRAARTLRQRAAPGGAPLPRAGRVVRGGGRARARRQRGLLSALGQHELGLPVQLSGLDQRQDHPEHLRAWFARATSSG